MPDFVDAYSELIESLRRFQDLVAGANPPAEITREVTALLERGSDLLNGQQVSEHEQVNGRLMDVAGRAQALIPVLFYDTVESTKVSGRVTFGRVYLGGNGAAHGGTIPLVFDDLLGRLAVSDGRPPSRTAYLTVNYRKITPIGRELQFQATIDRVEGRKQFLTGTLHDGTDLVADAEGLFVVLKPGQP